MIFQQFRNEGCLSYIIGDENTGQCAVIDPAKNIDQYIEVLKDKKLVITHIIDTHSHADHITGAGELSLKTGSHVVMNENVDSQRKASEGKGIEFGIGDILKKNSSVIVTEKVKDGDRIHIGKVDFTVIQTPGHTLDAMCLLMKDRIFSGDTLMIGLCGRTDLPGGNTGMMHDSIFKKLYLLHYDLLVYPAHDYKSNINSAMGYEKVNNPFFRPRKLDDFVKFVNKVFPPKIGSGMQCGIIDVKKSSGTGQLMGEMCVAMEKLFQELPADWKKWNLMDVSELKKKLDEKDDVFVLDVRTPEEYNEYHIKGAKNIPVKELPGRIGELPKDKDADIITHCESGFRSAHASIFLRAYGYTNVRNLEHGIHEWLEEGYEVER